MEQRYFRKPKLQLNILPINYCSSDLLMRWVSLFLACQHLKSETSHRGCEDQSWIKVQAVPYPRLMITLLKHDIFMELGLAPSSGKGYSLNWGRHHWADQVKYKIKPQYATQIRSWHPQISIYATSRKASVSISDEVIDFFNLPHPSSRTKALGVHSASNKNEYKKARPACEADVTAICEPSV
jgi:hypothetical protein